MEMGPDTFTLPRVMVICMLGAAGVFILIVIAFIWQRFRFGSVDPWFQAMVIAAGTLIFFIIAAKVARERW